MKEELKSPIAALIPVEPTVALHSDATEMGRGSGKTANPTSIALN